MAGDLTFLKEGWRPFRTSWLIVGTNADSLVCFSSDVGSGTPLPSRRAVTDGLLVLWVDPTQSPASGYCCWCPLPRRDRHVAPQATIAQCSTSVRASVTARAATGAD